MTIVLWLGILGFSDEDLQRTVVLSSWTAESSSTKFEAFDSKVLSNLNRVPFLENDETRVVRMNSMLKVVELKPKTGNVTFAAVGVDEIELDEFLLSFSSACALLLDSPKLTSNIIKSHRAKLSLLVNEMISQGKIERFDSETSARHVKLATSSSMVNRSTTTVNKS